ncbi:hypothetical protein [Kingella sp. (in: b-proteobacteria)]|uniref:hypothetical protein n=1 Tax=Kingella sp. (in: b-proteobacteria) TaxID=2020713 RepID=UPI0026DA9DBB|nr:hypothetical protein [Kingella sp. (in: b-proteobacteria)]MDO4658000.1 hypothetical protein [Kingella sp. (in: b-proteobacteria)]
MKNFTRLTALLACTTVLCACDKISEALHPASEPAAASQASAPAASTPKAINVREAFISACLSTASQQAPADDATMQYCGCVYDEGEKAYGDKAQWDSALAIDKPENMPEKLQKTVASVSDSCSQKFFGVSAASSAIASAPASSPASAPAASQPAAKTAQTKAHAATPAAASQPAAASSPDNAASASAVAASDASAPVATAGKHSGSRHRGHGRRRRR